MLPILPPTLRRSLGRPTKVSDEPQTTERLSKREVDMRSKDAKLVFTTKWLPQLSNRLPQLSRRLLELINNLPQLTKKMLPKRKALIQEETSHC
ncbi:hypothetical protein Goshw_007264 [Gossypium schwendimanii]|uniref:Uncharacterized protein n=1 Tax=Gossypium schwendimanii TaxID=34291 RepID=A0A7J9LL42_GOSSC|nr:hypothetical protein [Gossypium schwendimanii]